MFNFGLLLKVGSVIITLGVVVALFLVIWRKVPQDMAMVVTGLKKRIISGGGGIIIPFFERTDYISLENMQVDVDSNSAITSTGVEIMVDGVAVVKVGAEGNDNSKDCAILTAMEQFNSGNKSDTISKITSTVKDVLEGNMREIIATLTVEEIYQDRQAFLERVKSSAMEDLSKMGLQIISVNIKGIKDPHGYLQALGRPRIAEVKKEADIAEAEFTRETDMKTSEAIKEGEKAKIEAQAKIAEANKEKEVKVQMYKRESDASAAQADIAYEIQKNISQKEVVQADMDQQIMKKKKEIELTEEESKKEQKQLEIRITLPAEAQKRAKIIEAEAQAAMINTLAEANANKIRLEGEAEAHKILLIGEAEATAMQKKADAYKQYDSAAVFSMALEKLPEMIKNAAEPISAIDKMIVIDSGSGGKSGASKITGMVTNIFGETGEILNALTGVDIQDILKKAIGSKNPLADIVEAVQEKEKEKEKEKETKKDIVIEVEHERIEHPSDIVVPVQEAKKGLEKRLKELKSKIEK